MATKDKLWLYFEENYHDAATETEPVTSQTLYLDAGDAARHLINQMCKYKEDGFVVDAEDKEPGFSELLGKLLEDKSYEITMFSGYQENWEFSFSLCIMQMTVN